MRSYGFTKPSVGQDHYFGGIFSPVPKTVIRPDGQWDDFIPKYEPQTLSDGEETDGCTVWGTLNALEFLVKATEGGEPNYSERYLYNSSMTSPPGNDAHVIAQCIRAAGLVSEYDMPSKGTLAEFMKPRPMTAAFIELGRRWLEERDFMHEWVFVEGMDRSRRVALMKESLKLSPLGVSVTAWIMENGVYVDRGYPNNHWCVVYGWTDSGWKVFDSYDHSTKTVSFEHDIKFCKRYYVRLKPASKGYFQYLIERLVQALKDHGIIK